MGYESKLYVCKRVEHNGDVYNETLAAINMCKMDDFYEMFNEELNGDFCGMDGAMSRFNQYGDEDEFKLVDNYGDPLTYTSIDNVISWCAGYMAGVDTPYWRIEVLKKMLDSIKDNFQPVSKDGRERLIVVHYGY